MAMDIKRDPAILRKKRIRQGVLLGLGLIVIIGISAFVMRLQPAAPTVPASTVWVGVVQRGSFTREVHGAGTLVPEDIRWIPATTTGRVAEIVLQAGADVKPDSVILRMTNPDLEEALRSAELDWKTSKAQLENQRVTLRQNRLTQESAVADATSQAELTQQDYEANKKLSEDGIISQIVVSNKLAALNQAKNRLALAQKNLQAAIDNEASQLAPAEALVNQKKGAYDQALRQVDDLNVKAGLTGRLQLVNVDKGAQVGAGTNLVRVADPTNLKANVRISETQTKDLALGLHATIDTRNGIVKGHVSRIDPAANGGTVGVDVTLEEPLPAGARQDMSVDGTIELEKLENVLYVQHPAFGQENSSVSLFKILEDGQDAIRTTVKFGRASVNYIEVVSGLQQGDKVILSDMSQFDSYERVRGDAKFPLPSGGGQ